MKKNICLARHGSGFPMIPTRKTGKSSSKPDILLREKRYVLRGIDLTNGFFDNIGIYVYSEIYTKSLKKNVDTYRKKIKNEFTANCSIPYRRHE